jgi:hypothetical protein
MNRYCLKYLPFFILSITLIKPLKSQTNTLYYLEGAPQSYYMNPATQPVSNFFLGAPIFSSFQTQTSASGIRMDQIYYRKSNTDSITLFYKAGLAGEQNFVDGLSNVNYAGTELAFNIASFGFRVKEMYFTFDITSKLNETVSFPKTLAEFAIIGNYPGQQTNLNTLGFDFTEYIEMGLGISKKFGDQLSIGIRPKMLFGIATLRTFRSQALFYRWTKRVKLTLTNPSNLIQPLTRQRSIENCSPEIRGLESTWVYTLNPLKELRFRPV